MPNRAISIAVIDDHPMLAEGVAAILAKNPQYSVVGRGASARDLIQVATELRVDVLISDISMPGDVFAAMAYVREHCPDTHIIAYTGSISTDFAVKALNEGAKGFVLKGSPIEELITAIETVVSGSVYITPSFAPRVITALQAVAMERQQARLNRLSVREEQIVKLLLCGRQNREIAATLGLSERTVKGYMTNLMTKLGARNRLEVVIAAQKIQPSPSVVPDRGNSEDLQSV